MQLKFFKIKIKYKKPKKIPRPALMNTETNILLSFFLQMGMQGMKTRRVMKMEKPRPLKISTLGDQSSKYNESFYQV